MKGTEKAVSPSPLNLMYTSEVYIHIDSLLLVCVGPFVVWLWLYFV